MSHSKTIMSNYPAWLAPFQPQRPLEPLVEEVNRIFHAFEAEQYDGRHPEVREQGVPLWREMIAVAQSLAPRRPWRILDFGCGTGFATLELLNNLQQHDIAEIVCYDLSPPMLAVCRRQVTPRFPQATFVDSRQTLAKLGPFDVLATNALLHHLPDPLATARELAALVVDNGVWLAGHEPSQRFYKNRHCWQHFESFRRSQRRSKLWRLTRYLDPRRPLEKVQKLLGLYRSPKAQTACVAFEQGLFGKPPTPHLIDRLVDFHVAHTADEADAGRGFDYREMARSLRGAWELGWFKSYSFMGPLYENRLPSPWQAKCQQLSQQHPEDGASFCTIWRRA